MQTTIIEDLGFRAVEGLKGYLGVSGNWGSLLGDPYVVRILEFQGLFCGHCFRETAIYTLYNWDAYGDIAIGI